MTIVSLTESSSSYCWRPARAAFSYGTGRRLLARPSQARLRHVASEQADCYVSDLHDFYSVVVFADFQASAGDFVSNEAKRCARSVVAEWWVNR